MRANVLYLSKNFKNIFSKRKLITPLKKSQFLVFYFFNETKMIDLRNLIFKAMLLSNIFSSLYLSKTTSILESIVTYSMAVIITPLGFMS